MYRPLKLGPNENGSILGVKNRSLRPTVSYVTLGWNGKDYLHHDAVPTLRDLLEPVDKRPKVFLRGYDVYNPVNGGSVTAKQEASTIGLTDEREREKLREDRGY